SSLELQLIRSSLATKTDDELAELLERSVMEVRAKIDEITGGGAMVRNARVKEVQELVLQEKRMKQDKLKQKESARKKREEHRLNRLKEESAAKKKARAEAARK